MDEVSQRGRLDRRMTGWCCSLRIARALTRAAVTISLALAIEIVTREASAETVGADAASVTAYRRIFVPADAPAKWPTGNDKYLPVASRDFETWVGDTNRPAGSARIVEAHYQARFDGDRFVDGRAQWKIQLADELPALMPLDEMSIVIDSVKWGDDDDVERPARLGWWTRGDDKPLARALQVEHSGELKIDWHTLKAPVVTGQFEYPLRLPEAAATRFALDIPDSKVPTLPGALVLSSEEVASVSPTGSNDSTISPPAPSFWRRWMWAVGATTRLQFRIADRPGVRPTGPPSATFREDMRYHVTNQGLDTEVRIRCHAGVSELRELDLLLAPSSKIVSVTADDQPLAWHLAESAPGAPARTTIELPPSQATDDFTVVIKAWDYSVMHQSWPLPTVQVTNAFWTAGSTALTVDDKFAIEDVVTDGCAQTSVRQDDQADGRSSILEFADFSPTASIELRLGSRPPSAHMRTATSLQVGGHTIDGRIAAQLHVDRGNLPTIYARLQPGWTIDAVQTIPAESLGQWHIDTRDEVPRLELVLNHSAGNSKPLTIVVTGVRRLVEPLESLNRDALEPLHWQNIEVESNLLQLQATGRYELKPSSDLSTIAASDLSDEDQQLFAAPAEGQVFDLSAAPPASHVGLTPTAAIDDVDVEYEATLRGDQLQQSYHVLCRPRGSGIDQLLLYFSEPLGAVPEWEDADSHEPIRAERMPESDPRFGGLPPGGELWTLRLRRLYARPISLVMNLDSPWLERRPVPMVSSPDAATQTGRVTIRSTNNGAPAIAVQGMSPAPLPETSVDGRNRADTRRDCAIYRYEPVHFYQAGTAPRLWLGPPTPELDLPGVVTSRARIDSYYAADGSAVHRVACHFECKGSKKLEWKLPGGVRLQSVQLDSITIPPSAIISEGDGVRMSLPESFSRGILTIELRSVGPPLGRRPQIAAPFPTLNGPVLSGEWNISTPSEFAAVGPGLEPNIDGFNWKERLLGPLMWLKRASILSLQHLGPDVNHPDDQASAAVTARANQLASLEPYSIDSTGWRTFHMTFAAAPPEPIYIEDQAWSTATAVSAFLLSLFVAWMCRIPARTYLLLTATTAALAICLPANVAPFTTGVLWGLLLSPICQRVFQQLDRPATRVATNYGAREHLVELAMIAIVASLISAVSGTCAPPTAEGESHDSDAAIHRVLVPVDTQGQPAGSKYFVCEQFLRQLLKASTLRRLTDGSCRLSNLQCKGTLGTVSGHRTTDARRWKIAMDVEAFSQDAQIELPLLKSQANWSDTASVDGVPTSITWNAGGVGCTIMVREPGRHRLSIELEPRVETVDGICSLKLELPPFAGAGFQLDYLPSQSALNVNGGQLDRHDGPLGPRMAGELDGSGHLAATWIEGVAGGSATGSVRVDELSWLHIERDDIELELKLLLRGASAPDAIGIAADQSWELLPSEQYESTPAIEPVAHSPRSIRVPEPSGSNELRIVSMRFRLRDAAPPGQFRIPPISVTTVPIASQRLAASIESKWDCEASGGAVVAAGAAAANDFAASWGEADREPPQFVLNITESRPGWFFAVRPHIGESKMDQQLAITAARDRLKLRYDADCVPQGAGCFRYSLAVPEGLKVDRIFATAGGQSVILESVRVAPNRVTVFFAAGMTNPIHFVLTGSVPVTSSGATPLPLVNALDPKSSRQAVQIFHEAGIRVQARNLETARPLESSSGETADKTGPQLVGAYLIDPARLQDSELLIESVVPGATAATTTTEASHIAPSKQIEETSRPSVRLAETTVSIGPAGSWYAVTKFHITPHGLTQCLLQLPEAQSLVMVELDSHEALIKPIDSEHWRVQLSEPSLPQTLEVVARGTDRFEPGARIVDLARPSLWNSADGIPVEVGLWSLNRPASATLPLAIAAARVSPLEAAVLRLDRLTSIAESSTHVAKEIPGVDAGNWFVPRIRELLAAERAVEALRVQSSGAEVTPALVHSEDDPASLAVASSQAWIAQVEELAAGLPISEDTTIGAAAGLFDESLGEALPGIQRASYVSQGNENQLKIELVPIGVAAGETRISLLVLIVGLASVAIWFVGRPRAVAKG
jgi:hypothetical protein